MIKPDLSVVILNFNSKDYLLKCLKSVKDSRLGGISLEIILVDNNSKDGSQDELKSLSSKYKDLKIILNEENYGFSRGNNIGAKYTTGKYILFLNPDTYVEKQTLKTICEYMEENLKVGVCCPRLDLPDGTLTSASHRGFPTPWNAFTYFFGLQKLFPKSRIFAGYTMGWLLDSKEPHEVDSISGGFFFVRRKAAEEVGWWDEDYFLYGEDIDFCYRLKQKGWKVVFLPQISVLHYHGVSSGIKKHTKQAFTDVNSRAKALKASTQAMKIFYKKHYKNKYPWLLSGIVLVGIDTLNFIRKVKGSI